uniref:Uncharacterized protein n=1 Tax=Cacopsylla melanoneura TaxID=428564 RepID=A0A8D9BRZ7_9HEMI
MSLIAIKFHPYHAQPRPNGPNKKQSIPTPTVASTTNKKKLARNISKEFLRANTFQYRKLIALDIVVRRYRHSLDTEMFKMLLKPHFKCKMPSKNPFQIQNAF